STAPPPVPAGASIKVGPYEIRASLWRHGDEELSLAFDPALRRQIWIHVRPLGGSPVSTTQRDLSRPARLRWLTGGKTEARLWDAYDALEGRPLLTGFQKPASWSAVRFWLLDLAN